MEENEKKQVQNGGEGGRNHGRRRRHRHGKGHGGNGNNGNNGNGVNANNGNAQEQKGQKQNAPQGVNNGAQKGQGKAQQQKNKQPMPQKGQNAPQSQPNQQGKNKQKNKNEKKVEQQPRKDTYVYVLEGKIYLNLTNKCSNGCDFCVRNERASYYGNYLWLQKGEPTAAQVIAQINGLGDLTRFKEAVFCGFGEPTYRMDVLCEVADFLHEKGLSVRLNTNGQGNLINKRDIIPELVGKIDLVNVSLNASCYEKYQKICRSMFREAGFDGMVEFAKNCKRQGVAVRFSIVDCIGEEEVEACKRLAQSVNVPLYIRNYISDC